MNANLLDTPTINIWQYNITRYVGCEFHIKIVHPTNDDIDAEVILLTLFILNEFPFYIYN